MHELPVYILDAFAFMAYIQGEPAAKNVREILLQAENKKCRAYISIINVGEIMYNVERNEGMSKAQDVLRLLQSLPIEILPADDQTVLAAAHVKANYSLSYADAFVVIAAQKLNGVIMTGDPEFAEVAELAKIEWLKKKS